MAAEEMLSATILHLRAKTMEVYSLIKDKISRPLEVGDLEQLANLGAQLAQLEGAVVTMEHYKPKLVESLKAVVEEDEIDEEPELDATESSHEILMERSPTYKQSVEDAQLKESLKKTKE